MLWAQWILFIAIVLGTALATVVTTVEVFEYKRDALDMPTEILAGVILLVLAVLAGAFDKIFGWPL